ncbi:hypothetical protein SeLEV6574_g02966 [Synchytrium endobioticum]|nr:hypothetical protein SeLEV6574_g02966 [Synchytrium endobioticum]
MLGSRGMDDESHHGMHADSTLESDDDAGMSHHSMPMVMSWSYATVIIFEKWTVTNGSELLMACILVALLSYSLEALRYHRAIYDRMLMEFMQKGRNNEEHNEKPMSGRPSRSSHSESYYQLLRSLLHGLEVGLGFFVMLLTMSMNWYIFFSIVIGSIAGFYVYQTGPLSNLKNPLACH